MRELVSPAFVQTAALLLGLLVGSFLNVVIHRLPIGQSVVSPGSHCPSCEIAIRPWDNLPLLSYLWLRGRCRNCHVSIGLRYPTIELMTGLLFWGLAWRFGASFETVVFMFFSAALVGAAAIDFDHQIIPDEISLGAGIAGVLAMPAIAFASGLSWLEALIHSGLGALLGGGFLWAVGFIHARVSVALGRTFPHWPGEGEPPPTPAQADYWLWFPGIGLGDVKFLAMIGIFLGPWGVLDTLLVACVLGLVLGLFWAAVKKQWSGPFGFGPALAAAALITLFWPLHAVWILSFAAVAPG